MKETDKQIEHDILEDEIYRLQEENEALTSSLIECEDIHVQFEKNIKRLLKEKMEKAFWASIKFVGEA